MSYTLLRCIVPYYYLSQGTSRKALKKFYLRTVGGSASQVTKLVRANFAVFGQTLIDRTAFLAGLHDRFKLTFEHEDYLLQMKEAGKGGVLLSAHLGNWEMAGNLLEGRVTPTINIVMLDEEVEKIKQVVQKSVGESKFNIIPIKNDLSHVISIRNALARNEFVAIHADRTLPGMKSVAVKFFDNDINLPLGPFLIASKFSAPVTFVFAVKTGDYQYHLSATLPINQTHTPEEFARLYVQELEKRVRLHPEQWFNFYDYFGSTGSEG